MNSPDQYRLLLVEDNDDHVILIKRLLAKGGLKFELDVAGSAVEAMVALGKNRYHTLLVDFGLPDCTGTASVNALKKHSSETPVIVLTASSEQWLLMEALECGVEDVFVKTEVTPQLLGHAIRRACARHTISVRVRLNEAQKAAQEAAQKEAQDADQKEDKYEDQNRVSNEAMSRLQAVIDRCTLTSQDKPHDELFGELNSIRQELIELASKLEQAAIPED